MDIIFINDFRLDVLIGIYDWEHTVAQTVQFDLKVGIPGGADGVKAIGDTIDYAKVVGRIEESLRGNHFPLVEKLAEHVAQLLLKEFATPWVKVSVTKLAPLKGVKRLGVTIERGKK
ncbi:MAG: dihydroneopterin aldolase [Betaproteobacteria bacterium]|nr:dihydroneopterin aldolase [Betaproteobacteria bacterium]